MKKDNAAGFSFLALICFPYFASALWNYFLVFSKLRSINSVDAVLIFTKSLAETKIYILRVLALVMDNGWQFMALVRAIFNALRWPNIVYLLYYLLLGLLSGDEANCNKSWQYLSIINAGWLGLFISCGVMFYFLSASGTTGILIERLRFLGTFGLGFCLLLALLIVLLSGFSLRHLVQQKQRNVL